MNTSDLILFDLGLIGHKTKQTIPNLYAQSAGAVEYTDCTLPTKTLPTSVQDMKLNNLNGKVWGMQSTPLLPSLPVALGPGRLVPDRALSMA